MWVVSTAYIRITYILSVEAVLDSSSLMTRTHRTMAEPSKSQPLTSGWSFKQTDTDEWISVKRVPTNVHLDLLDHEKYCIPLVMIDR